MFCDNSLRFSLFAKVPINKSPVYKKVNGEKGPYSMCGDQTCKKITSGIGTCLCMKHALKRTWTCFAEEQKGTGYYVPAVCSCCQRGRGPAVFAAGIEQDGDLVVVEEGDPICLQYIVFEEGELCLQYIVFEEGELCLQYIVFEEGELCLQYIVFEEGELCLQ